MGHFDFFSLSLFFHQSTVVWLGDLLYINIWSICYELLFVLKLIHFFLFFFCLTVSIGLIISSSWTVSLSHLYTNSYMRFFLYAHQTNIWCQDVTLVLLFFDVSGCYQKCFSLPHKVFRSSRFVIELYKSSTESVCICECRRSSDSRGKRRIFDVSDCFLKNPRKDVRNIKIIILSFPSGSLFDFCPLLLFSRLSGDSIG